MTMTYEVGQRVEVERWAAGIDAQALDGPTWTPATVVGGHSFSYTLDVDGCGEGFIAVPVWLRPSMPAGRTAIAGRSIERMIVDDLGPPTPEHNATCRCGAPSLALFTSHECSRGPECPIVAGEPEPDEVRYVDLNNAYYADQIEVGHCAVGRGHEARHPLREGAIAAWRAKVAAPRAVVNMPPRQSMSAPGGLISDMGREVCGYALADSTPDPERPGHHTVMVQVYPGGFTTRAECGRHPERAVRS